MQLTRNKKKTVGTSVVDPHHFGNLDPHPDPHQIKIQIRIRIHIEVKLDPGPHQVADDKPKYFSTLCASKDLDPDPHPIKKS